MGNCGSVSECMTFCDISENQVTCINWAASKKIVSEGEAKKVRDMNKKEEEFKPNKAVVYLHENVMHTAE